MICSIANIETKVKMVLIDWIFIDISGKCSFFPFLSKLELILIAAVGFCWLGEMTQNNFLAALNSPCQSLMRRERVVGSIFEDVANETCNQTLIEEKKSSVYVYFYRFYWK